MTDPLAIITNEPALGGAEKGMETRTLGEAWNFLSALPSKLEKIEDVLRDAPAEVFTAHEAAATMEDMRSLISKTVDEIGAELDRRSDERVA